LDFELKIAFNLLFVGYFELKITSTGDHDSRTQNYYKQASLSNVNITMQCLLSILKNIILRKIVRIKACTSSFLLDLSYQVLVQHTPYILYIRSLNTVYPIFLAI